MKPGKSLLCLNIKSTNCSITSSETTDEGPIAPAILKDFTKYLPWACHKFNVPANLKMSKERAVSPEASKFRSLGTPRKSERRKRGDTIAREMEAFEASKSVPWNPSAMCNTEFPTINITTTHTSNSELTHIKIDKAKHIPRELVQLMGLCFKLHPQLKGICINGGADKYTIYEIKKAIAETNITDLCFDNCYIPEANYDTLLDVCKSLQVLSLNRCMLNDNIVKLIAGKIHKTKLAALSMSSNGLTDATGEVLAGVLRKNSLLSYLNLAGNLITDVGAEALLAILYKFPFDDEETEELVRKKTAYLKKRQGIINDYLKSVNAKLPAREVKTKPEKRTSRSSSSITIKKNSKTNLQRQLYNLQLAAVYTKAEEWADSVCGHFKEPFLSDSVSQNGKWYCNGNHTLTVLNLAYNNISFITLQTLLKVLKHQKSLSRNPRGLVSVCVEGNLLPIECPELTEIDLILRPVEKPVFSRRKSHAR